MIALGAAAALGSCGGGDSTEVPSDELVRVHIQDTLELRTGAEGTSRAMRVDDTITIERDGRGTRTSAAFDGTRAFRVPADRLERLERALAGLDLQALESRFGAEDRGDGTVTVTYGGQTVTLDTRVLGLDTGGNAQAERLSRIVLTLQALANPHRGGGSQGQAGQVGGSSGAGAGQVGAEPSR